MFTQLQYAGHGWFVRKTFQGVNCIEKINFRRGGFAPNSQSAVLGYTKADLDRVEHPDHCLHMLTYYASRTNEAVTRNANDEAAEYTERAMQYVDSCMGQITRSI